MHCAKGPVMGMNAADLGLDFEDVFRWVNEHRNFILDLEEAQGLATSLAQTDFIYEHFGFAPGTTLDFSLSTTLFNLQTEGGVIDSLLAIENRSATEEEAFQALLDAARFSNNDPATLIFKNNDPFVAGGFLDFFLERTTEKYPNFSDAEAKAYLRQFVLEGLTKAGAGTQATELFLERAILEDLIQECFGPEVPIDMWPFDPEFAPDPNNSFQQYDQDAVRAKIWKKPIELICVGDWVVSHDKNGNMVPGYVPRIMTNDAKILLDFHGTAVTPGHVYYRPDSKRAEKYETLIDVLRDDGMIEDRDGVKLRAATYAPVDGPLDKFVQAVTGTLRPDVGVDIKEQGRIRLGTRFIVRKDKGRKDYSVADLIEAGGGVVGDDELIRVGDGPGVPFHWDFGDTLPKPEDFVLAASGTTLEDIYKAAEWESQGPRLPAPMVLDGGPVRPLKGAELSAMPRNEPNVLVTLNGQSDEGGISNPIRRLAGDTAQ